MVSYTTPIVRLRVQECIDTFVALANAGFFSASEPLHTKPSADRGQEKIGEGSTAGDVVLGAWSIRIAGIGADGISWLARAIALSGARAELGKVPFEPSDRLFDGGGVAPTLPFATLTRRGGGGFYLRLILARGARDEDEVAFRRLIYLWMALVRVLPARDGRGRARLTSRPSYERGGNVLAVAGQVGDVDEKAAAACFFAAVRRFHHDTAPVVTALAELG